MDHTSLITTARHNRLIALKRRAERRVAVLTAAIAAAPLAASPQRTTTAAGLDLRMPLQLMGLDHGRRLHLAQFG